MIPLKTIPWQSDAWTRALADAITDPRALLERLELDATSTSISRRISRCACRVSFVERMRVGDPADPLAAAGAAAGEPSAISHRVIRAIRSDEAPATLAPGVIQKYTGRVLLIAAPACAVHCRYCFRRTFPYADHQQAVAFPSLAAVERDTRHHRSDFVRRRSADAEGRAAAPSRRRGSTPSRTCGESASTRVCRS